MAGGGDRMSVYATPVEVIVFMSIVAAALFAAPMLRVKIANMKRRKI